VKPAAAFLTTRQRRLREHRRGHVCKGNAMLNRTRIPLLAALCAAACACQPGNDAADDAAMAPADATDATTPTQTALAGAFTCADGSNLRLDWGEDQVVVKWPDGRTVTLPKAESASGPAGDAYVGDRVSIEHDGDRVVVRDGGKPAQTCTADASQAGAGGSDAAITMRYACESDTQVTVFADDSASVALPDGQQVTLSRVAGSAPPVFTGGSLFFSIGDDKAHLSQGDQANELSCEPA
jgi:membrane-bound inhibitor of C-type lysozyme